METYTIPTTLQSGTTYYWKVVGKTMANVTAYRPGVEFHNRRLGASARSADRIDCDSCFANADQSHLERCCD